MSLELRRRLMATEPTDIIIDARKGGVSGDAANDDALMKVIYAQKWSKSPLYMTKREAKDVSYVGEAFRGNTSITDFTAFKYFGVTKINSYDFFDCSNLKKIGISKSILEISTYTFGSGCLNLQYIDVDNDNTYYESLTGILYTKGLTEMLVVPRKIGGHVEIPNTILTLKNALFQGTYIESVSIPDSITSIGSNCFNYCTQLKTAKIGTGLTTLSTRIFQNCPNLILEYLNLPNCKKVEQYCFGSPTEFVLKYSSDFRLYLPAVEEVQAATIDKYGSETRPKYIYFGENLKAIGRTFFAKINTIVCMASTPPVMNGNYYVEYTSLYVPRASIEQYKESSAWGKYKSNIYAVEDINPNLLAYMKFETDILPQ